MEANEIIVNWCGYGTDEGCGYVCTEETDYCHHCGRRPVEKVRVAPVATKTKAMSPAEESRHLSADEDFDQAELDRMGDGEI